jgi:hypothetical protein
MYTHCIDAEQKDKAHQHQTLGRRAFMLAPTDDLQNGGRRVSARRSQAARYHVILGLPTTRIYAPYNSGIRWRLQDPSLGLGGLRGCLLLLCGFR